MDSESWYMTFQNRADGFSWKENHERLSELRDQYNVKIRISGLVRVSTNVGGDVIQATKTLLSYIFGSEDMEVRALVRVDPRYHVNVLNSRQQIESLSNTAIGAFRYRSDPTAVGIVGKLQNVVVARQMLLSEIAAESRTQTDNEITAPLAAPDINAASASQPQIVDGVVDYDGYQYTADESNGYQLWSGFDFLRFW